MDFTFTTLITRLYIDTRPLQQVPPSPSSPAPSTLPLIATLRPADQNQITSFLRRADQLMSLSSNLLKYHFIHRTAKIPWSSVSISRWPAPHRRPYWEPPSSWSEEYGLEFNVSHQAGLVALLGCRTPRRLNESEGDLSPDPMVAEDWSLPRPESIVPRLGLDIACTNELRRTPRNLMTPDALADWVDIFGEMFSDRERHDMKTVPIPEALVLSTTSEEDGESEISKKLRRFYMYWSLKEAFIKMVGEGLLASWLRELEFVDVIAPPPTEHSVAARASGEEYDPEEWDWAKWTHPSDAERGFRVLLRDRELLQEEVNMEVVAYDEDFLISTAMKGIIDSEGDGRFATRTKWVRLDIERDIRPCAEGRCTCLD